jgi:HYR domain
MKTRSPHFLIAGVFAVLVAFLLGQGASIKAQSPGLVVTPSNGEDFAAIGGSLEGPGVQIANVTYTGDTTALGTFTGGSGILGDSFERGIILSSGKVADAVGPNDSDLTTTGFNTPGDADLDAIIHDPNDPLAVTFDAAALEFDVFPTRGQVQFKYVFASEEYNEFANSRYNNVFAFFVTRPGFGDTLPTKVNCAVLPDGTPASINNINGGETGLPNDPAAHHPQFFRNNDPSSFPNGTPINVEGDGLTTELTCTAAVTPGAANHFKLVIADSGDSVLDTWVFVKAETLSTSETRPPDTGDPDPRLSAQVIVPTFTPGGGEDQTQQFTFNNLGLDVPVALQITQHQTLANLTLNATITLHNQDELSRSIVNPAEFPPNTVCKTEGSETGPVCLEVKIVDAATGEFPDPSLYNGPITWEITVDKSSLSRNVAYGMAHFEGNTTALPENIIVSLDAGVGESDNYSNIVVTESPIDSGPIVQVPVDITVPAAAPNPDAALVPYEVKAKGVVIPEDPAFFPIYTDLSPDQILCSPSSHSFPRGTTTVMCTATGDNNVSNTGSFKVTVTDNTPPVLTLPNIAKPQTGPLTPVTYTNATAIDPDDGPTPLVCNPSSGSGFPAGTTTVTCSSQDDSGNSASGSFTVTITGDGVAPVLTMPSGINLPATSPNGAVVDFNVTAVDAVDGPVAATCTPPSGSLFPIGTTQVKCKATDSNNNTVNGQFPVTVGCCDLKVTVGPANVNRGQNVTINITASNFSKKFIYGIVVFDHTSPCSHGLGGAAPLILLPGAKVVISFTFRVPSFACTGPYTFSTVGIFVDGSTTQYSSTVIVH